MMIDCKVLGSFDKKPELDLKKLKTPFTRHIH